MPMVFSSHRIIIMVGILLTMTQVIVAKPVRIVAITEDFASIAKAIGGDHVQVSSLVKGSRNLHNINARPSMVMQVRRADMLLRLGMAQDTWMEGLIETARNNKVFAGKVGYVDCSQAIAALEIPTGHLDGRKGDVHRFGNPHYWLDPNNGVRIAALIRDRLSMLDPEHKADFWQNYDAFTKRINDNLPKWRQKVKALQAMGFVTYHTVWSYFFDAFALRHLGTLEPLPGIPPSAKHLANLRAEIQDQNRPVIVLTASYYPKTAGKSFAATVKGRHVAVPVNVGEHDIQSYTDLFDHIIKALQP